MLSSTPLPGKLQTILLDAEAFARENLLSLCLELEAAQEGKPIGPLYSELIRKVTDLKAHNHYSLARALIHDAAVRAVIEGIKE